MNRTLVAFALVLVPTIGSAQEFTRYPGLSPTQQQILEPIRTPPPEPRPSPPVSMITPTAPVQSTQPQLTQFPGSGMPVDRRDRPPRGLKPTPQDRSKAPPGELTAPPTELLERATTNTPTTTRPTPPPAAPRALAPAPAVQPAPSPGPDNVQRAPTSATSIPPPAPAGTVTRTQPQPRTYVQPASPPQEQPRTRQQQQQQRVQPSPAPHETPAHWQTVTLPPAPDFSRRDEPAGVAPPSMNVAPAPAPAAGMASENAARARIEADGYRQVTGLTRGADGTWRGQAMRGSTPVGIRVDARGSVSAD